MARNKQFGLSSPEPRFLGLHLQAIVADTVDLNILGAIVKSSPSTYRELAETAAHGDHSGIAKIDWAHALRGSFPHGSPMTERSSSRCVTLSIP